jgi:hypothetical protein
MAAGNQMLLGIRLQLDANGMVTGASVAQESIQTIENSARRAGKTVDDAAKQMKQALQASALGIGAIGAAATKAGDAVMGALEPAAQQAKTFEVEMSALRFVTNATAEELKKLEDVAIKTGLETQFSPQEAAAAIRALKAAGLSTKTALESLRPALSYVGGSRGLIGLEEGAQATAASIAKFTRTGEDATKILNAFVESTRQSGMQMEDLPMFINSLRDAPMKLKATAAEIFAMGGALRTAKMLPAQAGQAIAMMADKFIVTQRRVSAYLDRKKITEEQLFGGFTDDKMPQIAKHFQMLGVSMFDAQGKVRGMTEYIGELVKRLDSMEKTSEKDYLQVLNSIMGARASTVISSLRILNRDGKTSGAAFKDLVGTLDSSTTAARESAQAFENTQIGLEKFIQGTKETIQIVLGKEIIPGLGLFSTAIRGVLNSFLELLNDSPAFRKALILTAGAFAIVAKVVGLVAIAMAGALFWSTTIGPAIAAAGGLAGVASAGFAALSAAMLPLLKIGLIIGAVFVAVMGLIKLYDHLMTSNSAIAKSFQNLVKTVKMVFTGISTLWDGINTSEDRALVNTLKKMGLWGLVSTVLYIKERVSAVLRGMWTGVTFIFTIVSKALIPIKMAISAAIDAIAGLFGVMEPMKDVWEVAKGWEYFGRVLGWIAGVVLTALIAKMALLALPMIILAAKVIIVGAVVAGLVYGIYRAFKYLGEFIGEWAAYLAIEVPGVFHHIVNGLKIMAGRIAKFFIDAYTSARNFVGGIISDIRTSISSVVTFLLSLGPRGVEAARGLISSFLDTLKSGWNRIISFIRSGVQAIRDFLPGSDAKVGPLSDITDSGAGLARAFSTGLLQNEGQMSAAVEHAVSLANPESALPVLSSVSPVSPSPLVVQQPQASPASRETSSRSVQFTVQKMVFELANGNPEDVERIAKEVMSRLEDLMTEKQEVEFA